MKKNSLIKKLLCLTLVGVMAMSFAGCTNAEQSEMNLIFNIEGEYLGFENIESNLKDYSTRQALRDGCYVCEDGKLSGGKQSFETFVKKSQERSNISCRFVDICKDEDNRLMDVYFYRMNYYVFLYDKEEAATAKYSFTDYKVLTGTLPGEKYIRTFCVLTNNEELTFEDILPTLTAEGGAEAETPSFCILLNDDLWLGKMEIQ